MDYEKAYKTALEKAREFQKSKDGLCVLTAESIFPELKESEDERIKKALIFYLGDMPEDTELRNGVTNRDVLVWLEKQGKQKPIMNVPTREVILSIWDLGNEWIELTNGSISTEYGTQLDYIQKHWHESEYYLREKKNKKKSKEEIKTTAYGTFGKYGVVEYVYILDYCSGRVIIAKHDTEESIETLFDRLGLKESQCNYMVSSDILSIEYINF